MFVLIRELALAFSLAVIIPLLTYYGVEALNELFLNKSSHNRKNDA